MASRVYDFNLASGSSQRFDVLGTQFRVISATGPVLVKADTGEEWTLSAGQGFDVLASVRMPGTEGGLRPVRPFGALTLRNLIGAANVGTIFIGDSGFLDSSVTGNVTIVDAIGVGVRGDIQSNLGAVFAANAFVAPGANPRGIILRAGICNTRPAATFSSQCAIMAKPGPPGGFVDGPSSIVLLSAFSRDSALGSYVQQYDIRRVIPPGWGLYAAFNAGAVPTTNDVSAWYEVL